MKHKNKSSFKHVPSVLYCLGLVETLKHKSNKNKTNWQKRQDVVLTKQVWLRPVWRTALDGLVIGA